MPTDLLAFFLFIGAGSTISGLIALLLANWEWFADLGTSHPLVQQAIKLVISVVMSVTSFELVANVPPDTISKFNPLWMAIATGINVILMQATQAAHAWYANLLAQREIRIWDATIQLLGDVEFSNAKVLLADLFPRKPIAFRDALIAAARGRALVGATARPVANTLVAGVPAKTVNAERPPLSGTNA